MTALREIGFLLDGPGRYWIVAGLAVLLALICACLPAISFDSGGRLARTARTLARPGAFLFAVALALFAMRWPLLFVPFAFNPDESQGIAQAITILSDPVFYRSVQSGSAGPLWTYPIALPALLGLDLTFGTTRFVGILILASVLATVYFSVRIVSGEIPARFATLLGLLCFGLPSTRDFLHYSSEYPALPLLGIACVLFLRYARGGPVATPARDLFLLGLALGAVPYAKLQATVIALSIAVFAGVFLLRERDLARREKQRRLACFIGGGVSVPALFSLLFLAFGVLPYFWNVYIVNNFQYKERGTPFLKILMDYMTTPIGFEPVPLVYKTLVVAAFVFGLVRLALWLRASGRRDRPWLQVAFAALVFAVSIYAVAAPGRHFPHYLHLIVLPLCLLCGLFMHEPADSQLSQTPRAGAGLTAGTVLGAGLVLVPALSLLLHPVFFGPLAFKYPGILELRKFARASPRYPGPFINQYKKPGDHLTVWGWYADYHVDTQLPMGTRSAVSEFHIRDVPLRDYYRRTYLAEFKERKPAFFIDAVGPLSLEFTDPALHGHQIFPELAAYVAANYVDASDPNARTIVRFFVRRDRAEEIRAQQRQGQPPQRAPAPGAG